MTYDKNNVFAKIIRGEMPSDKVYEDEAVFAIRDIAPAAPAHILVMPKGEYISFDDFNQNADDKEIADFFRTVRKIANEQGLGDSGYRIIMNHQADACQSVPHFHVHILGGRFLGGLLPDDTEER